MPPRSHVHIWRGLLVNKEALPHQVIQKVSANVRVFPPLNIARFLERPLLLRNLCQQYLIRMNRAEMSSTFCRNWCWPVFSTFSEVSSFHCQLQPNSLAEMLRPHQCQGRQTHWTQWNVAKCGQKHCMHFSTDFQVSCRHPKCREFCPTHRQLAGVSAGTRWNQPCFGVCHWSSELVPFASPERSPYGPVPPISPWNSRWSKPNNATPGPRAWLQSLQPWFLQCPVSISLGSSGNVAQSPEPLSEGNHGSFEFHLDSQSPPVSKELWIWHLSWNESWSLELRTLPGGGSHNRCFHNGLCKPVAPVHPRAAGHKHHNSAARHSTIQSPTWSQSIWLATVPKKIMRRMKQTQSQCVFFKFPYDVSMGGRF